MFVWYGTEKNSSEQYRVKKDRSDQKERELKGMQQNRTREQNRATAQHNKAQHGSAQYSNFEL